MNPHNEQAGADGSRAMEQIGFTPSDLLLPYPEWAKYSDAVERNLRPETKSWLYAWRMWDLAVSPMDDAERRRTRYGHYLGWHAAPASPVGQDALAEITIKDLEPLALETAQYYFNESAWSGLGKTAQKHAAERILCAMVKAAKQAIASASHANPNSGEIRKELGGVHPNPTSGGPGAGGVADADRLASIAAGEWYPASPSHAKILAKVIRAHMEPLLVYTAAKSTPPQGDADPFNPKTGAAIAEMINAFLKWPLPESVCADACATTRCHKHRSGTNLLTMLEAMQMFQEVVCPIIAKYAAQAPAPSSDAVEAEMLDWLYKKDAHLTTDQGCSDGPSEWGVSVPYGNRNDMMFRNYTGATPRDAIKRAMDGEKLRAGRDGASALNHQDGGGA